MLDHVSRLPDGDYEQSMMVQLFVDCVDRATASSNSCVSFREQPLHFKDNQTLNLREVDPIGDEGVWAIIDDGCNRCCHGEVWRQKRGSKNESSALSTQLDTQKSDNFQRRWSKHNKWRAENSRAVRLQESDLVMPGCVHSRGILEKTHPLLVFQACQAKLGMTKRVRDGSITLDDHDAQSMEVARRVGTGLFMIRIDH